MSFDYAKFQVYFLWKGTFFIQIVEAGFDRVGAWHFFNGLWMIHAQILYT